jgi:choline dehydrogenase-like flavoprotein
MQDYDYVIVGAGPAGCVLANKLSADPAVRVALLEAGPEAHHPLISMPKGFGKLLVKSPFVTHYPTEPDSRGNRYVWARGRSVGGSTSVNGMAYSRGQPEDFDAWEARGARGWGWQQMLAAFREIEDHELGADAMRGSGGPLHVGVNRHRTRFTDAVLKAAPNIGLPVREEVNREDQVGIAPMTHMIRDGRRVSAADAFLTPVRGRPNLHVFPNTTAQKLLFEARRCRQVQCVTAQGMRTFTANREIMVCGGAFETPKLLMLSGIGPAAHLREHGIEPIHDSPGVGANMSEHRGIALQYRLKGRISHNPQFSMPRLFGNVVRYFLFRSGVLSYGSHELMGFARVLPESKSADTQLFISPFSRVLGAKTPQFEAHPGAPAAAAASDCAPRTLLTFR